MVFFRSICIYFFCWFFWQCFTCIYSLMFLWCLVHPIIGLNPILSVYAQGSPLSNNGIESYFECLCTGLTFAHRVLWNWLLQMDSWAFVYATTPMAPQAYFFLSLVCYLYMILMKKPCINFWVIQAEYLGRKR